MRNTTKMTTGTCDIGNCDTKTWMTLFRQFREGTISFVDSFNKASILLLTSNDEIGF